MTDASIADSTTLGVPTLAIQQLFSAVPAPPGDKPPTFPLAAVQSYAGGKGAFESPTADGYIAQITEYRALYSVIGNIYGQGGPDTFAFPDLTGRIAIGGPAGEHSPSTLSMTYLIAAEAGAEIPLPGMIALFAGPAQQLPPGWLPADGATVPTDALPTLFGVIGYSFGGSGDSFQLPDLTGAAPMGTGAGPCGTVTLGDRFAGEIDGLGLTYLIATQGIDPSGNFSGALPSNQPFLGQMVPFAADDVPPGWAQCNGQMLSIESNMALFRLLGARYGGDGQTDFAVPNLAGTILVGSS